jgi:hypothetical protein
MKSLKAAIAMLLCITIAHTTNAQTGPNAKPKLFSNYPQVIECAETELAKMFITSTDNAVTVNFQSAFSFEGTVTKNIVRYANLQSVFVKSSIMDNAIFSVSKATNADGSIEYTGRILNEKYFDGYELRKNTNGSYSLYKIETNQTLHLCNQ